MLTTITAGITNELALSRTSQFNRELKAQSLESAAACVAQAMLNYAFDATYRGDENINLGDNICTIGQFSIDSSIITVVTSGKTASSITFLQTMVRTSDLSLVSQYEITN